MDIPPETLTLLSTTFLQTLSPDPSVRAASESSLASAASSIPSFPLALLRLSSSPSSDPSAALAAAVHLKNLLRRSWPLPAPSDAEAVKHSLLPLLLSSPPRIRPQLAEALSVVAEADFPSRWPSLLPDIVAGLKNAISVSNYDSANALLSAANTLFARFRHSFATNDVRKDLKYCLVVFAAPLLETFSVTSSRIVAGSGDVKVMLESQRICCEIFRSLNAVELPEFFEDHMQEWMKEFQGYLNVLYSNDIEGSGAPDALRAAICENLQLYMEKNEEEFKDYLPGFATSVWGLLMRPSLGTENSRDQLAVTAIKFLTTVAVSVHHGLFAGTETLQQICVSVVFPNLKLREEDEELFESNYIEYIRRDVEGSDTDTLRRAACELLRGLSLHYRDHVTALVAAQVQAMVVAADWKERDAAIYLVVGLAPKQHGTGYLVDVEGFFSSVIVPELQAQDRDANPLLKADALKFFMVFLEQIPKATVLVLLPSVIQFLGHESNVVHSYASNCIEKLFLVKDMIPAPQAGVNAVATPRYTANDISPFVPQLLNGLFTALKFPESQENHYVMKCTMRLLGSANLSGDIAAECVSRLATVLGEVCSNPKNPTFNHYLFEAIAAVVGRSGAMDQSLIPRFESSLFPYLQKILVEDISEFWSYAFQIFTQLIDLRAPPLPESYMQLFQVLLSPDSWSRPAGAPAMVGLLQAYLKKMQNDLHARGMLAKVLDIYRNLLYSRNSVHLAFFVLNTLVENLHSEIVMTFIRDVWVMIFERLQNNRTPKLVKSFVLLLSLVLIKHGTGLLVDSINAVQQNIFLVILQTFWVPNLKFISGSIEVKLASVAATRLICESPVLLDATATESWGKMLDSIVFLLTKSVEQGLGNDDSVAEYSEAPGYTVSFARLHYAGRREDDPLEEVKDPKQFLVQSLASLTARSPGTFGPVIENFVDAANKVSLRELCNSYHATIV